MTLTASYACVARLTSVTLLQALKPQATRGFETVADDLMEVKAPTTTAGLNKRHVDLLLTLTADRNC